jgi:hypothetical protein
MTHLTRFHKFRHYAIMCPSRGRRMVLLERIFRRYMPGEIERCS